MADDYSDPLCDILDFKWYIFFAIFAVPDDWLPKCFKVATKNDTHLTGFVSNEEELQEVLESHSRAFSTTFAKW